MIELYKESRDGSIFEEIFHRHASYLYKQSCKFLHRKNAYRLFDVHAESEDIVSEIFTGLPDTLLKYEPRQESTFRTWITAILINKSCNRIKESIRHKICSLPDNMSIPDSPNPPPSQVDKQERVMSILKKCINRLPLGKRMIVERKLKKMKFNEIATELNLNINTIKTNYYKALQNLNKCLSKQDIDGDKINELFED